MPFFCYVEQEKVGAVVQVVVETVLWPKSNRRVDLPVIEHSFDSHILISENIFRVVEIDLEPPSLLFIQQKAQPVIVLRDRERFAKQPIIPTRMIMRLDADEIVIVSQRRLRNMDRTIRIEFTVVSPGTIHFLDKMCFLFRWVLLLGRCRKGDQGKEYIAN